MPSHHQLQGDATDREYGASPVSHFEKFLRSEHSIPGGIENIAEKKRDSIPAHRMEGYRRKPKVRRGGGLGCNQNRDARSPNHRGATATINPTQALIDSVKR